MGFYAVNVNVDNDIDVNDIDVNAQMCKSDNLDDGEVSWRLQ